MPEYEVVVKPSVEKDLRKIPTSTIQQIINAFRHLEDFPCKPPDRKLTGTVKTWRHRVGEYRIVYEVDHNNSTVTIQYVRHRREVYRRL